MPNMPAEGTDRGRLDGPALVRVLRGYAEILEKRRHHINAINVFPVSDADTGSNLLHTVNAIRSELDDTLPLTGLAAALQEAALLAGRGASGLIFSQAIAGLCSRLTVTDAAGGSELADALSAAAAASYAAVVDPVEGTMLSAAKTAARGARSSAAAGGTARAVAGAARDAAWEAVVRSPTSLPMLAEAGVVDSGAVGYALFLDVLVAELDGEAVPERSLPPEPREAVSLLPRDRFEIVAELSEASAIGELRERLAGVGSAAAVASRDGHAHVHVHCSDPVEAYAAIRKSGVVDRLEVTDLHAQALAAPEGVVLVVAEVLAGVGELLGAGADRLLAGSDAGRLMQSLEAAGERAVGIVTVGDDREATEALVRMAGAEGSVVSVGSAGEAAGAVRDLRDKYRVPST